MARRRDGLVRQNPRACLVPGSYHGHLVAGNTCHQLVEVAGKRWRTPNRVGSSRSRPITALGPADPSVVDRARPPPDQQAEEPWGGHGHRAEKAEVVARPFFRADRGFPPGLTERT